MKSPHAHEPVVAGPANHARQRLRDAIARDLRRHRLADESGNVFAAVAYLGTLGVAIAAPIVAGAFIGAWLDSRRPGYSSTWTLSCLIVGVVIGTLDGIALLRRSR